MARGRWHAPELRRHIEGVTGQYGADVTLVENTELGRALSEEMRLSSSIRPILWASDGEKFARMAVQAVKFEVGEVFLPRYAP